MKNLTLKQFQQMTNLPDAAIGWLLKHNKIRCSVDAELGILVIPDEVNGRTLTEAFAALSEDGLAADYDLVVDRIMDKLDERLELIVDEAVARLAAAPKPGV